jgi:hypothetical protein
MTCIGAFEVVDVVGIEPIILIQYLCTVFSCFFQCLKSRKSILVLFKHVRLVRWHVFVEPGLNHSGSSVRIKVPPPYPFSQKSGTPPTLSRKCLIK